MDNKFLTKYNHSNPVSPHGGVSMTDQQYKDECDIDIILKRYKAGEMPVTNDKGFYGDFSDVGDFASCMERVERAKAAFADLPSELRARFGNDVTAYYNFVLDPRNAAECQRLGLRELPVQETADVTSAKPEVSPAQDGAK